MSDSYYIGTTAVPGKTTELNDDTIGLVQHNSTNLPLASKVQAIREGHLGDVTVSEIDECRKRQLVELGVSSDGNLPKDLSTPPGFLRTVFDWILDTSNCPQPMFALSAALALAGTVLGQKIKSSLGQFTNIFAMNVGKSSSGKDYPRQAILTVLDEAEAGHLWRSKVTSDAAIEAALAEQPNILITIDEAGHFLKSAKAKGNTHANTIKPAFLELWSSAGKTWKGKQRARATGKPQQIVVIENPCVCFYGATQPEVFFSGVSVEDIRDGWIPRNLFFFSQHQCRPEIKEHSEIPQEILKTVRFWTGRDDGETANEPLVIAVTDDAKSLLNKYAEDNFSATSSESASAVLYGKVIENTIRVALICAVSRHICDPENAIITDEDIIYAYNLVKFLSMTMEDVLKANLAENETERMNKRLYRIIREAGSDGITTSLLTGKSRWLSGAGRKKILDDLIDSGDIKAIPTQKGGSRFVATSQIDSLAK